MILCADSEKNSPYQSTTFRHFISLDEFALRKRSRLIKKADGKYFRAVVLSIETGLKNHNLLGYNIGQLTGFYGEGEILFYRLLKASGFWVVMEPDKSKDRSGVYKDSFLFLAGYRTVRTDTMLDLFRDLRKNQLSTDSAQEFAKYLEEENLKFLIGGPITEVFAQKSLLAKEASSLDDIPLGAKLYIPDPTITDKKARRYFAAYAAGRTENQELQIARVPIEPVRNYFYSKGTKPSSIYEKIGSAVQIETVPAKGVFIFYDRPQGKDH